MKVKNKGSQAGDEVIRIRKTVKPDMLAPAMEKYSDLFNFAPIGYLAISEQGLITEANLTASELTGIDRVSLINKKITGLILEDDHDVFSLFYEKILTSGGRQSVDLRMVKKPSGYFWAHIDAMPAAGSDGTVQVRMTVTDITTRIKLQESLVASERKYRKIIDTIPDGIWIIDSDNRTVFANPAMCRMLGYSLDEMIGKSLFDFMDAEGILDAGKQVDRRKSGTTELHEFRFLTKAGQNLWTMVSTNPIMDQDGIYTGAQAVITNITDLKKSNEDFRTSEEKWKKLVTNIPDYVGLLDKEGNFLFLNHFPEGFSEADVVGKRVFDFLSGRSKTIFRDSFEDCKKNGITQQVEFESNGAGMQPRTYHGYLIPMNGTGKTSQVLTIARDITSQKRSEEIFLSSLKEKEVLFKEVHHRVKNNLQVISSLLNMQAQKIQDESLRTSLQESRNRIRSIAIVHEKLYNSDNSAEINLKEYTHGLVEELSRAYAADPAIVDFSLEIDHVSLPLNLAVPFGMILNEIISNSLQHAFPENSTRTEKQSIFISVRKLEDGEIQLHARDNGTGFAANREISAESSLGLYLINVLSTGQLNGNLAVNCDKGVSYTITFNPFLNE